MESSPRCDEVRAVLPLVLGGELEPSELAAGERHLASCGTCRAELERYRAARDALRRAAELLPPAPAQWDDLRALLCAEGRIQGAGASTRSAAATARRRPWFGAAVALLLAAVGVFLLRDAGVEPAGGLPLSSAEVPASEERAAQGLSVRPVALRPLPREEWPAAAPQEQEGFVPLVESTRATVPAGSYTRRIR